jgi:hypothetical protein
MNTIDGVSHEKGMAVLDRAPSSGGASGPLDVPPTCSDGRKSNGGPKRAPSPSAHPIIRQIFELAAESGISTYRLAVTTGYAPKVLAHWKFARHKPAFHSVLDLYNALGYDLVPVKREEFGRADMTDGVSKGAVASHSRPRFSDRDSSPVELSLGSYSRGSLSTEE